MSRTIRRHRLSWVKGTLSEDESIRGSFHYLSLEEAQKMGKLPPGDFRHDPYLKKMKRIDLRHGFIEAADGACPEEKVLKINGKIMDENAWTQRRKKNLKWRKHRKERQWRQDKEDSQE